MHLAMAIAFHKVVGASVSKLAARRRGLRDSVQGRRDERSTYEALPKSATRWDSWSRCLTDDEMRRIVDGATHDARYRARASRARALKGSCSAGGSSLRHERNLIIKGRDVSSNQVSDIIGGTHRAMRARVFALCSSFLRSLRWAPEC
jgi:hypothetical protein